MEYYCDHRIKSGKLKYSRTRLGIHSLTHWIASTLKTAVIETNVYTYPTASVKELKKVNADIKDQSKELFWQVFMNSGADIAIFCGAEAFRSFFKLIENKNVEYQFANGASRTQMNGKINVLEEMSPLLNVKMPNREVSIFAIRHLMYYGDSGASFEGFRNKLKSFYTRNETLTTPR